MAKSSLSNSWRLRQHSAFSLIEAAIVLAVIGLVIGGIWVAASTVRTNHIVADVLRGVQYNLNSARIYVKNHGIDSYVSIMTPQQQIDIGLMPADWVPVATYFNAAPGDIWVAKTGAASITPSQNAVGIIFAFTTQQRHICRRLLTALTADYATVQSIGVYTSFIPSFPFGGAYWDINLTAPISPSSTGVATTCDSSYAAGRGGPTFHITWKP